MKQFRASVWKEGDWFVAQCLDVDVASQGKTEPKALEALKEAPQLHFAPPFESLTLSESSNSIPFNDNC